MNNTTTISYSLHNTENYNPNLGHYTINDILSTYGKLVIEYLKFITDKIKLNTNNSIIYNRFIILRGLKTITHVFNTILYYSKNLDMSLYYGQKSFYFYVEFITQISGGQTFLQLTSRDAIIFVYKKSIFDINNEVRKSVNNSIPSEDIRRIFNTLDNYITSMDRIITYVIEISVAFAENINKLEKIIGKLNNNNIRNLIEVIDNEPTQCIEKIEKFIETSK
jgi:hypothetical protein